MKHGAGDADDLQRGLSEPSQARKTVVVDLADRISLKIKGTEVIERTGKGMIEMRTQPRLCLMARKDVNP